MGLENMKNQSFPQFQLNEWRQKAVASLKGKAIEAYEKTTYENIKLKPLYTREDEREISQFPGLVDFRRGADPLGYLIHNWKVAQRIPCKTPEELKEKLMSALSNGQTAISFEPFAKLFASEELMPELLQEVYAKYPFAVDAKGYFSEMIASLERTAGSAENLEKITGYVASDPLASFVTEGSMPADTDAFFAAWAETIQRAKKSLPNLRTVLVNAAVYHNGGANAIQELGASLATGVFYIQQLLDNGFGLEEAFAQPVFNFAMGANFFMEIAKLRAARIVWNKVGEVYGVAEKYRRIQIAAETSSFTKTIYDPYVNILRSGNEAFAAVLGGIQYLHVGAFDEVTGSSSFSERIARNSQLILQNEAHLQTTADPAGGSWYVEALTQELAEKAWVLFQTIEANGGILAVLKSNWLQEQISEVLEQRRQDVFTRKKSIVGTNVYANLNETVPENEAEVLCQATAGQYEEIKIQPILPVRLAQGYESLRKRASALKQKSGMEPKAGLICLGSLKQHKTRLDFIKGFLAAGGIQGIASDPVLSLETVKEFLNDSGVKHICLCGSDELYETLGLEIVKLISSEFPHCVVYLAGLPEKQEQTKWLQAGVKQFIHIRSNCYETLSRILEDMEVSVSGHAQT